MTAPVLQSNEDMRMAFVMPAGRSIDSLPVPNNVQVRLSDVDWGEAVALRFSGRGKQAKFVAAEATLREVMAAHQRVASGPALYAQYNSPSAFPPYAATKSLFRLRPNRVIRYGLKAWVEVVFSACWRMIVTTSLRRAVCTLLTCAPSWPRPLRVIGWRIGDSALRSARTPHRRGRRGDGGDPVSAPLEHQSGGLARPILGRHQWDIGVLQLVR